MANPPKPWKVEYAKSGRSSCKSCKNSIGKDQLRFGKMVASTQFDGFMPMWNHASCIFKKGNQIKSVDDVDGLDLLRWEDQQKIRNYIIEGVSSDVVVEAKAEYAIEISASSRASCKHCREKIIKGTVRVSSKPSGQGSRNLAWHHVKCFIEISPSSAMEEVSGWESLPSEEKDAVFSLVKGKNGEKRGGKDSQQMTSRGTKRKSSENDLKECKLPKSDDALTESCQSSKCNAGESTSGAANLDKQLEKQTKALWDLKDELKKNVTTAELREILEANGQDSSGSENDLRDRCVDGMLFGALAPCPVCSGSLQYSGGQYRCRGYASAWSKCTFSTLEPLRVQEKWKIPEETSNKYLVKWFKSLKAKKTTRILPPTPTSNNSPLSPMKSQPTSSQKLEDLKFAISVGLHDKKKEDWRNKLEESGAIFHSKIKEDTSCLVLVGVYDFSDSEIKKARRMRIPILREDYLQACFENKKKLPFDLYKVETTKETEKIGTVTVKVKGRSAVHESSNLQDTGHILEHGKSIYNTTLSMSDLSTGINSYYILQIIEEDKGSDCHLFRKWGRVGNDKIGGFKLEEMSKSDAIQGFKRLFLEKTGNTWEAWEQKHNFQKQPGRFFPLDIDYGVKELPNRNVPNDDNSLLNRRVVGLMKMLFNIETYRAAMLEFEINMSEMPLGKLSKMNIKMGFEALTEIQNLLKSRIDQDPAVRESLIVAASNRFFTLIPSIHPHIIRDEEDFQAKVKMLEALQDIEIASRIVGFDGGAHASLDDKYKKLKCDIAPLEHDSEDYKMVEHYLLNTHAPTHKDWTLELEEVFALDRDGENDKYATFRDKLQNKMLLWHGSRLTNFVGILSQGLRIAPPEAPVTGYMFGKGIYFADLVSKSAQYCFVDKKNPVGLMLLSEVALGQMNILTNATYMEKPPKGRHSTKGLGKTVPLEAEFATWRNDVVVPCGKPVPSSIRASELMYNEYIVYNTAQVKMQFLLKVRFHHKR